MMKAMTITAYGGPEVLRVQERPIPQADPGSVVIRVRALGLNRAELYMRQGAWGEVSPVPGIECVGEVHADASGRLSAGQRVAALMGGMGRSIPGSYAEYVRVPASNVIPLETRLSWSALAAIPESYATAWTCLNRNLEIQRGQTLLVRGGTSALGQAAIDIARSSGLTVLATTRSRSKFSVLEKLGVARPLLEETALSATIRKISPAGIDGVLDLVGTSTIRDSLAALRRGGRACLAGFLGGHAPLEGFDPVFHMPSGVHLSVFASIMLGTPGFPLADVPLQEIVERVERGEYRAAPARVLGFNEIPEAHRLMEANQANGKLVVELAPDGA